MKRAVFGLSLLFTLGGCVATGGAVEPSGGGQFKAIGEALTFEGATTKALEAAQAHCAESGQTPETVNSSTTTISNAKWARIDFRCV